MRTGGADTRRGFHLTEILVALAIAAGPLLLAVHLVNMNARGARFNRDRATARMVLLDVSTLVQGERIDGIRRLLEKGQGSRLTDLLRKRIDRMPSVAKGPYEEQAKLILGRLEGRLEEGIDPGVPGLARMTLAATLSDQNRVEVRILFRPPARERLRTQPDASCDTAGQGGTP